MILTTLGYSASYPYSWCIDREITIDHRGKFHASICFPSRDTVQFNYNFKTRSMYTHGNPTRGHTVHVSCLRGPCFLSRVNMHFTCKIPCNTHGVAFHTRGVVFHTRGHFTRVASLAWPFQTCHFTCVEHGIVHVYYFGSNNSQCQ